MVEIPEKCCDDLGMVYEVYYWLDHMIWIRQDKSNGLKELQTERVVCMGRQPLVISGEISTMECTRNAHVYIYDNIDNT